MPNLYAHSPPSPSFIAVVDDDVSVRHALDRLITSLKHEVVTFANANEFLRCPHFMDAACLILDIQMPGLSGMDLHSVVAALRHPIPVIFITAHYDDEVRARTLATGAIGFLEKPFDDESLILLLDKALHGVEAETQRIQQESHAIDR